MREKFTTTLETSVVSILKRIQADSNGKIKSANIIIEHCINNLGYSADNCDAIVNAIVTGRKIIPSNAKIINTSEKEEKTTKSNLSSSALLGL